MAVQCNPTLDGNIEYRLLADLDTSQLQEYMKQDQGDQCRSPVFLFLFRFKFW